MDGDPGNLRHRPYTALFVFCGIGGAALGFKRAQVDFRAFGLRAGFKILGGIDIDPGTATDFERLTGAPCLAMDVCQITPALLREWFSDEAPDVVVFSPPCKQASGLLSEERAQTEAYRRLGALAGVWMRLMLETWPEGPKIVAMENVPRIRTRAPEVMRDVRAALRGMGYLFHEESHDLGELGGLAQHRERLLVMARHKTRVPALIYKPTPRRVRGVGEVLGALPMPGDPAAGPLHRLPALEFITALRLALIPAGGDWHDLPSEVLLPPELAALLGRRTKPSERTPFNDVWRVVRWDCAAGAVTGGNTPSAGVMSVADPRPVKRCHPHTYGVVRWDRPSHTITGNAAPGGGPFSVADPRAGRTEPANARGDDHGVIGWDEACGAITGRGVVSTGRFAVADPRITCKTRENSGIYGVVPWGEPTGTIVGHACHDNGRFSVADPRWPESVPFPVIISEDGTWHRPLTILERAVLQSFPATMEDGTPLTLTGKNSGDWSVRVGDAIPPAAFERVGEQLLMTLVNAEVGAFALSSGGGVWVEKRRASFGAETPCEGRA